MSEETLMPESTLSSSDLFDEVYPEGLPERLQWLEEHFGIGRVRMLCLLGLAPDDALSESTRAWPELVTGREPQAEQLEHLLTHYLSYFDYDVERAREFAKDFSRKVAAGIPDLLNGIPALAQAKTPVEQGAVLLEAARQDGGGLLPAMSLLLGNASEPGDENGTAARPPLCRSSA